MTAPDLAPDVAIDLAEAEAEVLACYEVVHELRTHLDRDEFLRRVRAQRAEGYALARLRERGLVRAVAGFRIVHNLFSGRVLYVDDLVTAAAARSRGHGTRLLAWLAERARAQGCQALELDSGVQRFDAHRFYLAQRMRIASYHFRVDLDPGAAGPGA